MQQIEKPDLCPISGHKMISRERKDGQGTFWACSGFPECSYIWKDPAEVKPAYRKVAYKYPLIPPSASQNANVADTKAILEGLRKIYAKIGIVENNIDKIADYLGEIEIREIEAIKSGNPTVGTDVNSEIQDIKITEEDLKEIF